MIVRMFLSAVSESDLDELITVFREDVVPAFTAHPDCLSIELIRAEKPGVGGLIEGGALIRWTSAEAMDAALASEEIIASQERIRGLLRRQPLRKVYEIIA